MTHLTSNGGVEQPLALPRAAKYLYGAATPKRIDIVFPVIKETILTNFRKF